MAIAPVKDPTSGLTRLTYTWTLASNETGTAVDMSQYPDRVVGIVVTSGTPTVTLNGSVDPDASSSWGLLTDYDANDLSYTSGTNVKGVRENTHWCRPALSGTGAATIYLLGNGVRQ